MQVDVKIDVTAAAGIGAPAELAATVSLPEPDALPNRPIVCFAKPGAGFTRRYFTTDLPGPVSGAQSQWHASRGWVFVSVDHLGVGDSSRHEMSRLDFFTVAAAAHDAERQILEKLRTGDILDGYPALESIVSIGLGQSMGGSLTVVQQAHHRTYSGLAVLGYSVLHSRVATPPGVTPVIQSWRLRDRPTTVVNEAAFTSADNEYGKRDIRGLSDWMFYYDDVERDAIAACVPSPWRAESYPGAVLSCLTPGVVAPEAAAVDVPVLIGMGERDVVADPLGEPRAYLSAPSIDLYTCPRMGHMHNFASTREQLWQRLECWGDWVRCRTAQ